MKTYTLSTQIGMLAAATASVGALAALALPVAAASCQPAGDTGQTAVFVNESVVGQTVNVSDSGCDIGAYFDEDAPDGAAVKNSTFIRDASSGGGTTIDVWNDGADVQVRDSDFTAAAELAGQHLQISFENGATGVIQGNTLTGDHRVGILLTDEETSANVKDNVVTGTGPRSTGWAENGIQVSSGATGVISGNEVSDHWWDLNNFLSAGIIIFGGDAVNVHHNTLTNNDAGIALYSDGNKAQNNTIVVDREEADTAVDTSHYGMVVYGSDNAVVRNELSAVDGEAGIYVYSGSQKTKLIRNDFSGWSQGLVDNGVDSTVPPANGIDM